MSTKIIPAADLREGDTIVAYVHPTGGSVRGRAVLPHPVKVIKVIETIDNGSAPGTVHFHAEQADSPVSPDRYVGAEYSLEIERPERPQRRATRTVNGVKFVNLGDKRWVTEDGRLMVEWVDDFEHECEGEHPVRITQTMRAEFHRASKWDQDHRWDWEVAQAIREGRKGYMCPGGQYHTYGLWVSGNAPGHEGPEVIARDERFTDALEHVVGYIETGETWE